MITEHLSVALDLRLMDLHRRLGDCGYRIAKANYQPAVLRAIEALAAAEGRALHKHRMRE